MIKERPSGAHAPKAAGGPSTAGAVQIATELAVHATITLVTDCHQVRRELEQLLCERFAFDHTTLQVDHAPDELLTAGGGTR